MVFPSQVSATQVISWGAPWYNESVTNGGGIGCSGGNHWINSQANSGGYIYQWTYTWNNGYPGCYLLGPWSSTKSVQSYAAAPSINWPYSSGTYYLYEEWYVAYSLTYNETAYTQGQPCYSPPGSEWFVEFRGDVLDKATGSNLSSTPATYTVVSSSNDACPSSYGNSWADTGYTWDVGAFSLTKGTTYQAIAELSSQTVAWSSPSGSTDTSIIVSGSYGQNNFAQLVGMWFDT
jgi:hypothetical protein